MPSVQQVWRGGSAATVVKVEHFKLWGVEVEVEGMAGGEGRSVLRGIGVRLPGGGWLVSGGESE